MNKQNKINRRKIPLTGFVIIRESELCQLEERFSNLEREFKKELTTNEIRSRIDSQVLVQTAEKATYSALSKLASENKMLKSYLQSKNHGRNLHIA